jgi:hypothetical protein
MTGEWLGDRGEAMYIRMWRPVLVDRVGKGVEPQRCKPACVP